MSALAEKAPRVDRDRLGACFDYAGHAHGDQRRDSGQPYLTHVVEVCRIVLDLFESRLDTTLACAALLHDVVEDTEVTLADVEKQYGKEVASLVEGVTKLSGLHFDSREAAQARVVSSRDSNRSMRMRHTSTTCVKYGWPESRRWSPCAWPA